LYRGVTELLRRQGYFTVYAGVSTPNPKSEAFHEALGFRNLGEFKNVGYKLGAWCGVAWYELPLADYVAEPKEPCAIGILTEREAWEDVLAEAEALLK